MGYHPPRLLYLFLVGVVQLVGILLFVRGFFPYKTYLPGFVSPADLLPSSSHPVIEPEFDRLVFVVIDALRNDFVFDKHNGFTFVRSLMDQGIALPFTAKAKAPTVTMPRIKALTTGTVPSFLDAILNIAESDTSSSLAYHDNWVHQLHHNANHSIHFFGDDTWMRLFPDTFSKTDGTTSFYVSDTVEVDTNVTRHIGVDLPVDDWNSVIMHYLGLDHVGHLGGPKSPLMLPKQQEMDQAIESIYTLIAQQDAQRSKKDSTAKGTLLVVCGDHGMNEAGNHGGSSVGEISTAMVFASPRFYSRPVIRREKHVMPVFDADLDDFGHPVIDQIDLVPTLSLLFGVPIPKNSLGQVILPVLNRHSALTKEKAGYMLRALQLNAHQLDQLHPNPQCFDVATKQHQAFLSNADISLAIESIKGYVECIQTAKGSLSDTASNYDLRNMVLGTVFILASTAQLLTWTWPSVRQDSSQWWLLERVTLVLVLGYSASVFASSFVEQESMIWYYWVQTFLFTLALQSYVVANKSVQMQLTLALSMVVQLLLVRAGLAWKTSEAGHGSMHVLAAALALPILACAWHLVGMPMHKESRWIQLLCKVSLVLVVALTSALVMVYKLRHEGLQLDDSVSGKFYEPLLAWDLVQPLTQVQLGQLIYNYGSTSLLILSLTIFVTKRASHLVSLQPIEYAADWTTTDDSRPFLRLLLYAVTPVLILLSRTHHSLHFILFIAQLELLLWWKRSLGQVPPWVLGFLVVCLAQVGFFVMDHGNTLADVDLGQAYTGVSDYEPWKISILTFSANWSGAIWWCMAGWVLVTDQCQPTVESLSQRWITFCLVPASLFSLTLAMLSLSVTVLREHLFIWTVFSPKYLYQLAWHLLYFWSTQMALGSVSVLFWYAWSHTLPPTHDDDRTSDNDLLEDEPSSPSAIS
ncbi:alkaline phosphatase-like protein [Hesseltinella vesiculosa]|uniref:GPI ethanolamine phosphate transferase 2 n=1 Tax=Hesseltinella vesiculosa TaxID=101127 RepID=A0A1X2G7N5_9FUNG|nr:alkaline phosphatase-like protein [Hesseltinella vesiculosa]